MKRLFWDKFGIAIGIFPRADNSAKLLFAARAASKGGFLSSKPNGAVADFAAFYNSVFKLFPCILCVTKHDYDRRD